MKQLEGNTIIQECAILGLHVMDLVDYASLYFPKCIEKLPKRMLRNNWLVFEGSF
ncbi:hypothetical protein [Heyndrickxia coagulans]|uniref:Uncharacterized protein n=1 Tax=Heyndrickxia coagulans TaxID=1398 RepID=A0A0C5CEY5_HEYCO|nr:hypothetical protein [Heyndrickxia coagulans]AJO24120.1 hypothetical protein SB48_HM08orf05324 [Heyndrickxia coagulans]KWZ77832.1 hypothetical protein HMPREF3213_03184 [Heyndrickxia coagulans]